MYLSMIAPIIPSTLNQYIISFKDIKNIRHWKAIMFLKVHV